jgi:hypothetical protein
VRTSASRLAGVPQLATATQTVEPVFGIIKSVMGFRQFMLGGLDNVRHEWPGVEFETHGGIASAVSKQDRRIAFPCPSDPISGQDAMIPLASRNQPARQDRN